ncbi:VOC family protein [Actinomadura rubrisoli]|uniref:VOC family protein n=1 Tax=Actinomadura rubrisoli TaxID=2530368 RepID=A0A4R5CDJ0_9ACTN|nr:VOC family protein [Actinomadura rubrisoli]TDD96313.1 VOC family protein [Actinomadura rubrisoli]
MTPHITGREKAAVPDPLGIQALSACISVGDLDACIAWYTQNLGFRLLKLVQFPELGARVAFLTGHSLRLELAEQAEAEPGPRRQDPPRHSVVRGVTQIAFYVTDAESILARARQHGLNVAMDLATVPELGLKAFFVRDPEENLIEFIELTDA